MPIEPDDSNLTKRKTPPYWWPDVNAMMQLILAASIVFMVTRAMADSVRVFATAIPIALIMGPVLPREYLMPSAILVLGALTIVYTWRGGMRAVVWTELLQAAIYVTGGICAVVLLGHYHYSVDVLAALFIAHGIFLIASGLLTVGLLIGFLLYVNSFYLPLRQLATGEQFGAWR